MTVSVAWLLVIEPELAVIVVEPTTNPVASPVLVPTTATVVFEEFQFTELVMFSAREARRAGPTTALSSSFS